MHKELMTEEMYDYYNRILGDDYYHSFLVACISIDFGHYLQETNGLKYWVGLKPQEELFKEDLEAPRFFQSFEIEMLSECSCEEENQEILKEFLWKMIEWFGESDEYFYESKFFQTFHAQIYRKFALYTQEEEEE